MLTWVQLQTAYTSCFFTSEQVCNQIPQKEANINFCAKFAWKKKKNGNMADYMKIKLRIYESTLVKVYLYVCMYACICNVRENLQRLVSFLLASWSCGSKSISLVFRLTCILSFTEFISCFSMLYCLPEERSAQKDSGSHWDLFINLP